MKILEKITALIIIISMIFTFKSSTHANADMITNSSKIANIAVLLYSFDDLYMQQLKQSFENIQKENSNKVNFSFYDGKDNISIQNQTLDSLLKNNIDLFIVILADSRETMVEDVISKVKPGNIPIILVNFDPKAALRLSKSYDKAAFVIPDTSQAGILQGKILINLWNANKTAIDKNNDDVLQYVLLKGSNTSPIAIERTQNVISTISNSGIKTEELSQKSVKWSIELAENTIESLLLKYGSRIEAIISNNDNIALGAIEALQKYGFNLADKSKYIPIVGVDGLPEAKDLIDKGVMTGTVIIDTNAFAEGFYNIGINLINNLNPVENTNYKYTNGIITIPGNYKEYTSKTNVS